VSAPRWAELEEELGWHLLAEARLHDIAWRAEGAAGAGAGAPGGRSFQGLRGTLPYDG